MKKDRILNPALISAIAAIGHTEYMVIADAGLPVPKETPVIDLSLIRGIPRYTEVLKAVSEELVVESYIIADEMKDKNLENLGKTQEILKGLPYRSVSHEELKTLSGKAKVIIRTGETTSFSNVILVAGVNF